MRRVPRPRTAGGLPKTGKRRLDEERRIDWSQFNVNGSNIRADRSAAGGHKESSKVSQETTPWDDPAEALARSFIW